MVTLVTSSADTASNIFYEYKSKNIIAHQGEHTLTETHT